MQQYRKNISLQGNLIEEIDLPDSCLLHIDGQFLEEIIEELIIGKAISLYATHQEMPFFSQETLSLIPQSESSKEFWSSSADYLPFQAPEMFKNLMAFRVEMIFKIGLFDYVSLFFDNHYSQIHQKSASPKLILQFWEFLLKSDVLRDVFKHFDVIPPNFDVDSVIAINFLNIIPVTHDPIGLFHLIMRMHFVLEKKRNDFLDYLDHILNNLINTDFRPNPSKEEYVKAIKETSNIFNKLLKKEVEENIAPKERFSKSLQPLTEKELTKLISEGADSFELSDRLLISKFCMECVDEKIIKPAGLRCCNTLLCSGHFKEHFRQHPHNA